MVATGVCGLDGRTTPRPGVSPVGGLRLGYVRSVREDRVVVSPSDAPSDTLEAVSVVQLRNTRDPILFAMVDEEWIILGQILQEPLVQASDGTGDIVFAGDKIVFRATQEVVLVAGRSELRVSAGGFIRTLADRIVARARRVNRVQGASVKLN